MKWFFFFICSILLVASCSTGPKAERGPGGTISYYVDVEANESGARVEANGEYLGKTPLQIKIFGDKDGTFHNFGNNEYVIKVFAMRPGQYTQTRVFRTGRWFSQEDHIPKRLYFDLNEKTESFSLDAPKPTQPTK